MLFRSDKVVRGFAQTTDDGMVHDVIGDMEVVCVFNQGPAGFATARIASEGDVRLKIGDGAIFAVESLLLNRLEEKLHRLLEPLPSTGSSRFDNAPVKTCIGVEKCENAIRKLIK